MQNIKERKTNNTLGTFQTMSLVYVFAAVDDVADVHYSTLQLCSFLCYRLVCPVQCTDLHQA